MFTIGLIREGKIPADNRVALTPAQCKWVEQHLPIKIKVQHSETRCFKDREYAAAGIDIMEDMESCDVLLGIKEVPIDMLLPGKTYLFFSHTKKMQPFNQNLLRSIISKKITLIDYECLEHDDGTRIIGFGFFAGVVGAHNGMMAYGNRTSSYKLGRVYKQKSFQQLIHTYFGLQLPNLKIAVAGSGRVAHGILEVMNLLEIHEVEPEEYRAQQFDYPVYVHLKGADLYADTVTGKYSRSNFHLYPENYQCLFRQYLSETDILLNGVYWDEKIPRFFEMNDLTSDRFKIVTIADISDDKNGSVPCNIAEGTMEEPIYGVDKITGRLSAPYLPGSIDLMAVSNLPNELPRDASRYFGEQLIKFILKDLAASGSKVISNATIVKNGALGDHFHYLRAYAGL